MGIQTGERRKTTRMPVMLDAYLMPYIGKGMKHRSLRIPALVTNISTTGAMLSGVVQTQGILNGLTPGDPDRFDLHITDPTVAQRDSPIKVRLVWSTKTNSEETTGGWTGGFEFIERNTSERGLLS